MRTPMGQRKGYLIGDVARIVGISRDALRFYEKKGVIQARKGENGYRYYSEMDIYRLMYVVYHRKMNSSLKEIETLMTKDGQDTVEFMQNYLDVAIQKEQEEIDSRRRTITRLKLTKRDMEHIVRYTGMITRKSFPRAYVVGICKDLQEALEKWFQMATEADGMDMAYFYTQLFFDGTEYMVENTRLLFYKGLEEQIKVGFELGDCKETYPAECIYTVTESQDSMPDPDVLEKMTAWGKAHQVETTGEIYVNTFTSCALKKSPRYFLEVYMPTKEVFPKEVLEI